MISPSIPTRASLTSNRARVLTRRGVVAPLVARRLATRSRPLRSFRRGRERLSQVTHIPRGRPSDQGRRRDVERAVRVAVPERARVVDIRRGERDAAAMHQRGPRRTSREGRLRRRDGDDDTQFIKILILSSKIDAR